MKNIFDSKKITFWNQWAKQDKALYVISLFVLTLSIIFFFFTYHTGLDLLIQWNVVSDTIGVNSQLEEFQRNLNSYALEVQTFFVSQHFEASNLSINVMGAKIYLVFIAFSFSIIMTAISMIRKIFWYAVSMTVVFAWLAFLKLDTLAVLGLENNALLIGCLVLYGGISFLFHAFKTETATLIRFITFLAITIGLGIFILNTSALAHPYIHLTNYGTIVSSIATLIFVVMVAYDVLNGLFSISIQSQSTPMKGLINFGIISLLYLGNLLMVYFNQIGWVKWDFNFFNPFYLFILATVLGIWANRRRSVLTEDVIHFHSAGALLYIGLAINAVMTFAYTFATTNDPMSFVLNDMITYSFLCMGLLFLIYVVLNFFAPIKAGIDVYEYMFKPKVVGHHFIRVGGLVMMFMLVAKYSYKPYKEWKGAYYNFVADVYTINNEPLLAKHNYEKGNNFSPLNHKSNYTLASLELQKENYAAAIKHFKKLELGKNMSEFAYVNLAHAYEKVEKPYKSTFTLQSGVKTYPKSGILNHNLAYNFQQYHNVVDSMYIYYDKASALLDNPSIAQANILTLLGQNQIQVNSDSLYKTLPQNDPILENNYLALNSILGKETNFSLASKTWDNDSIASSENSCFLYNYAFTQLGKNDTLLKQTMQKYIQHPESAYPENLKFALACLHYYDNELLESKNYLDDILLSCSNQLFPYYSNFAGILFYKRHLPTIAQEYFEKSAQAQRFFVVNSAPSNYAYTIAENSSTESMEYPLLLISSLDTLSKQTFSKLAPIFENPSIDSVQQHWTDEQKFQYLTYHPTAAYDSITCLKVLKSVKDSQVKAKSCAVVLDKVIETNARGLAEKVWNEVPQIEIYPRTLEELNFQYLCLLTLQYKFNELSDRLENIKLSNERQLYYYYLKGIAFQALGDTVNAKIAFDANLKIQPLFDKGYVESAKYISEEKQYDFLVNASYLLPKSAALHKSLALASLKLNMNSYAEVSYNKLSNLLSDTEFKKFEIVYHKTKQEAEKRFNEWEE